MKEQNLQNLRKLREGATKRNSEQVFETLGNLLLQLPTVEVIQSARDIVVGFLPVFERYFPDVKWPRASLDEIERLAPEYKPLKTNPWLPKAEDNYPSPGANNFIRAIQQLCLAAAHVEEPRKCVNFAREAVAGAIVAGALEYWYGTRLDDWKRWFEAQTHPETGEYFDQEVPLIALKFRRDPDVVEYEKSAWHKVADKVERRLKNLG